MHVSGVRQVDLDSRRLQMIPESASVGGIAPSASTQKPRRLGFETPQSSLLLSMVGMTRRSLASMVVQNAAIAPFDGPGLACNEDSFGAACSRRLCAPFQGPFSPMTEDRQAFHHCQVHDTAELYRHSSPQLSIPILLTHFYWLASHLLDDPLPLDSNACMLYDTISHTHGPSREHYGSSISGEIP